MSVIDDIKDRMGSGSSDDLGSSSGLDGDFGGGDLDLDSQKGGQGPTGQNQGPQSAGQRPNNTQNMNGGGQNPSSQGNMQRGNHNQSRQTPPSHNSGPQQSQSTQGSRNNNLDMNSNSSQASQHRSQNPTPSNTRSQSSRSQGSSRSPNPQTGRPRKGNSSPQLSQNTRKEMEHAGMNPDQSVSEQRSDMEELKAQNEQIIDLLKRINRNLSR